MNWELEFRRCLEKRWLVPMPEAHYLVEKELKAARDDLDEAEAGYRRGGYKWSTIQSYYAMFHTPGRCCTAVVTAKKAIIAWLWPCAISSSARDW